MKFVQNLAPNGDFLQNLDFYVELGQMNIEIVLSASNYP